MQGTTLQENLTALRNQYLAQILNCPTNTAEKSLDTAFQLLNMNAK